MGVVNVRLQHISDECIVSLGNIAYHFPNKEAIVFSLYQDIQSQQKSILSQYRSLPLFVHINRTLEETYALQKKYSFFYVDTLEINRAYPSISKDHQTFILYQVNQIKNMIEFNQSRGAFRKNLTPKSLEDFANHIWEVIDFSATINYVRYNHFLSEAAFKQSVWSVMMPHFTQMGIEEYGRDITID